MVSRGRSNKQIIFSVQFINSFLGAFTTSGAGVMKNFLGAQPWEGARESKVIKPWLSRGKWVIIEKQSVFVQQGEGWWF